MKIYRSKISWGIVFFITLVLGSTSAILIVNHVWAGLVINVLVLVFITYMFINTFYIIAGNELIIRSGFMINKTIQVTTIKKMVETNSPLSSPAASLDRILIYYNATDSVMISPKNKTEFIHQLSGINPKIEVVTKK